MSYLLFMDESGHDHKVVPYEVRGGICLQIGRLWPFIQAIQAEELAAFGGQLHTYHAEIKGGKLLGKRAFAWAAQAPALDGQERRRLSLGFLNKGAARQTPTRLEFTAFGQACIEFVRAVFRLMQTHEARIFAAAIPRGVTRPVTYETEEYLRKDQVFLLERYFYFLEQSREKGLLVMDESERMLDRDFVRRVERYFTATRAGRFRTSNIVPVPFFVASDMTYPVQVADICIYAINWGFRLPASGMDAECRAEIADEFGPWLRRLQYQGDGYNHMTHEVFRTFGITFVSDPYGART